MPILLRILIQRLLFFVFSILAFFGINPDLSVPSETIVEERKEVQQERVDEILQTKQEPAIENIPEVESTKKVEEKINDIQKEFTKTITQPLAEKAQEIIPTNLVFEEESKDFNVKDVVVNIICLEKTNAYTRMTSGSGVIISSSGLVLTNAHVTFPFLKTSQFGLNTYSCSIRRENIPNYGYNAEVVYYPIDWLRTNQEIMKDPSPVGTGENDYAFLQITSGIGPTPKSRVFPFAATNITSEDLKKNTTITVAGYPSSNSGVFELDTKPGLKIADTIIYDFFTFGSRSYDVLQTGNNIVAHKGSSGGGIFNQNNLYGIVVTTNSNGSGSYINALTLPYIKKDFKNDTNFDFNESIQLSFDTLKSRFDSSYKERIKEIISQN